MFRIGFLEVLVLGSVYSIWFLLVNSLSIFRGAFSESVLFGELFE